MSDVINLKLLNIFMYLLVIFIAGMIYWNCVVPFACIHDGEVVANGDSYTCEPICYNYYEGYTEVYENGYRVGFCLDENLI